VNEHEHLTLADRHIAECRARITRQRLRIGRAIQQGHDTDAAEDTLDALKVSLRALERHRELILDRSMERGLARNMGGGGLIESRGSTPCTGAGGSHPLPVSC
jgi:hypothetical protein